MTKPFDVDELKARLRTGERILELEDRLVEARESMRFQATHDLLTSLWNRGVIMELVTREVVRTRREGICTAVMMCDIDHFKKVNDQFGHAMGDEVLREVARRLQLSVRSSTWWGAMAGKNFWWRSTGAIRAARYPGRKIFAPSSAGVRSRQGTKN